MDPHFRLCLLGIPRICSSDQPINGFRTRKALALLCYLAARATDLKTQAPLSRTLLADLFWSDLPEAKGRSNLSYALHNLNDLFPGALVATRDTIALDESVLSIDAREFRAQAGVGTAESLARAARLYHDEFMAGLFLDDCPEFELWLVSERERWRQRIVSVLECLGGYHARLAEYERALPYAVRILEIEPWREEAHRHMMQLYARTGQRSAALQQYETCRRVLAEELGAEPGAETLALFEKIRAAEMSPPRTAAPNNLPTPLTSFVGREADLARIDARLKNPDCRLLSLVGAGGIGKTRLALKAAAQQLDAFRDGVFSVSLVGIQAGQIDSIAPAIAEAIGYEFAGANEPRVQLGNHLRALEMLMVLDNFEHLLEGREVVNELLKTAPAIKFMVTTRQSLNLQAEWVMRVDGLSYPPSETGQDLIRYSAVQLFLERAGRADGHFKLDRETAGTVVRICQRVEGMPLALELAAARLRTQPVSEIAAQLEQSFAGLETTMLDVEARHSSLRAVLDWSYGLLEPAEQILFRRLAVFQGGWMQDAAKAVVAGGELTEGLVPELTARLIDKSLFLFEQRQVEQWYWMLEPVREYALEKLAQHGEIAILGQRHAEFYLRWSDARMSTQYKDYPYVRYLMHGLGKRLEVEVDNLRAALTWSLSGIGEGQMALRLAETLLFSPGFAEQGSWLETALRYAEAHGSYDPHTRARLLHQIGVLRGAHGDYAQSAAELEKSSAIFQKLGDRVWTTATLERSGWVAREQGNTRTARAHLEQALAVAYELESEALVSETTNTLAETLSMDGDLLLAQRLLEENLTRASGLERWSTGCWTLNHLGHIAQIKGEYVRAEQLHREALSLARDYWTRMEVIYCLGETALAQGDVSLAKSLLNESLGLAQKLGIRYGTAWCLASLAGVAMLNEEPERAAWLWGAAEQFRQALGVRVGPATHATHERLKAQARDELGEDIFATAWARGASASIEEVIADVLNETMP